MRENLKDMIPVIRRHVFHRLLPTHFFRLRPDILNPLSYDHPHSSCIVCCPRGPSESFEKQPRSVMLFHVLFKHVPERVRKLLSGRCASQFAGEMNFQTRSSSSIFLSISSQRCFTQSAVLRASFGVWNR